MNINESKFSAAPPLCQFISGSDSILDHLVCDAGKMGYKGRNTDAGVDERLPTPGFFAVFKADQGNLGNAVIQGRAAGSLQIQHDVVGQVGKHVVVIALYSRGLGRLSCAPSYCGGVVRDAYIRTLEEGKYTFHFFRPCHCSARCRTPRCARFFR